MHISKKWIGCFFLFIILIFGKTTFASELRFSVETEIPTNQIDKEKTYFDLLMKKDAAQALNIRATNHTNEALKVNVMVEPATTNSNGVVEYAQSLTKLDASAALNIADILTLKSEEDYVTIPANDTTNIELTVKMPNKDFKGVVAGGITLSEVVDEQAATKNNGNGMAIENRYAYTIAALLRQSMDEVAPDLKLANVAPNQKNGRNIIEASLINPEASYLNQLAISTKIVQKKSKEVILEKEQSDMQMAPNSVFHFPIEYNEKTMTPGEYTLQLEAKGSKQTWVFTQDFTITIDQAKILNKTDVVAQKNPSYTLYIVVCIVLMVLLIVCLVVIYRMKKSS